MKNAPLIVLAILVTAALSYAFLSSRVAVDDFTSCVAAGNSVLESYPRQCSAGGRMFTEDIGNTLEKANLIRLDSPYPGSEVVSPVTVRGEARGPWFFEASFPVFIVDWDGKVIGQGIATAGSDWMTEGFVPFTATVSFDVAQISGEYARRGTLILKKDNPSGLPEHDDALEIPIRFR